MVAEEGDGLTIERKMYSAHDINWLERDVLRHTRIDFTRKILSLLCSGPNYKVHDEKASIFISDLRDNAWVVSSICLQRSATMASWLIDTPLGELIRVSIGSRWLPFPEEQEDWILRNAGFADGEKNEQPLQQQLCPLPAQLVGWYGIDDPANPQNWSPVKKARVYLTINYCACTVYMSSSIYTSSQDAVEEIFHTSSTVASLGLALFVLAYGIGPLLFAPISEVHSIGRNIPYIISLAIFIIISVVTATASNLGGLLTLRFLQGFFGSPALATGGASLSDVSDTVWKPFALYTWAFFSFVGPSIGPVLSTVAVERLGWRWSLWEIVFLTTPAFLLMASAA